ncbi:hypothetical protein A2926_04670 [Candidatus Giovannonibacteria bacterium RIFCSPLOWO2_01_FULL_44_40]|uniref:Helix-turn-helix type 11 domain-containing protein n=1 Tax=Candidatus Giovannonibacteria bacterium RIFCSPHIGHO2_01_FULL_45_23 TaxID=1798325 RepID=A0A1F5VIG4_9BACT|nr:MAG: hypothetical protein A2834_03115 [Candidatus Giovannonibacteria bacterium RIFCSPHIGHO2_01_FULL_45_23]OGF75622.1 MAG: hypothetical protein A3C77_00975 [Candidatus Giovannonibacteria bacterium RIFCSPHIGHO2_02_FULL_45_13]OGF80129.1 MAG: hypothetical protein A2926_04670 [Candidatus Giovannonibacteria bacterium RIFCSPLOWO2_01_FULL_44_40]
MLKKEVIWREILFQARQNKKIKFTQKELALKFGFSLSTIFNALKPLRSANIIKVGGRFFALENYRKLLYLWASERNIKKEIIYSAHFNSDIKTLEGIMPPGTIFGAFSGFSIFYGSTPAEYDHLYVYADEKDLEKLLKRISEHKDNLPRHNFFVIKQDPWLLKYPAPLYEQIFVDIWNAPEWYAKDFLKAMEEEIK